MSTSGKHNLEKKLVFSVFEWCISLQERKHDLGKKFHMPSLTRSTLNKVAKQDTRTP